MDEKERDAQRLRSVHGGHIGGPARARRLTPERRSEIARAGVAARAKRFERPALKLLSPADLVRFLRADPFRTFTKPELRKIVRGFGYHLDRPSHRYWHPAKPGWIALPPGKHGIVSGSIAREILRPLLNEK
jgi:hypothetical protein